MDVMVFVLDSHKQPLIRCSSKRARLLLSRRRALAHRLKPFVIRLKDGRLAGWCLALALAMVFFLPPADALASPLRLAGWATMPTGQPSMQVSAGFDTRYRNGNWVPVHITLRNNGADFSGALSTSNPPGPIVQPPFSTVPVSTYEEPITLPNGIQKQVTMYLPIYTLQGVPGITVHLLDRQGNILQSQSAPLHVLGSEDVFVGLLSDQDIGFDPLQALQLPVQNGSVVIQFLNAQTMPGMAAVLNNFKLIVLDNFRTSLLTHEQLMALQTWVNQGGALIEVGGSQWRQTLSPLPASLLPVSVRGTNILPAGTRLLPTGDPTAQDIGAPTSAGTIQVPITVSTATAQSYTRTILSASTTPLLVQAYVGKGSIFYLAFDPTAEPIVSWPDVSTLWKGLLFRSRGEQLIPPIFDPDPNVGTAYSLAKLQHLLFPLATPSPWVLLLFFLGYLLILGPARWLIIRRLKRREWSWRIVLSAIVVFSLLNYGTALYQQGASIVSNSLSIIRLSHAGSFAHSTSYVGLYVPFVSADGTVQVHLPDSTLVQPFTDYTLQKEQATITTSADGLQVNVSGAEIRTLDALQVEQDLPVQGGIISHLTLAGGTLTGTVTNTLPTALSDVYVLMPHSIVGIGNLDPGQTSSIRLAMPVTSTNVGLSVCKSLVHQVAASGGGTPVQYSTLLTRNVQQQLDERQRHESFLAFLLTSLQCNSTPWVPAGASPTLIGWADQPLDAVNHITFNGISAGGLHETLLLAPLGITYAAGSLTLPPDMLPGQLVDANAVNIRHLSGVSYALAKGQVTFEYSQPMQVHAQKITLTVPVDSSTQPYIIAGESPDGTSHISLYNWQTGSWDAIKLTPSTAFTTQNTRAYIGPDGRVLVQYVNQATGLAEVAFTKPALSVTGIVS